MEYQISLFSLNGLKENRQKNFFTIQDFYNLLTKDERQRKEINFHLNTVYYESHYSLERSKLIFLKDNLLLLTNVTNSLLMYILNRTYLEIDVELVNF